MASFWNRITEGVCFLKVNGYTVMFFHSFTHDVLVGSTKGTGYSNNDLGPVVQSIVSLTSSLRGQLVKCFTTL